MSLTPTSEQLRYTNTAESCVLSGAVYGFTGRIGPVGKVDAPSFRDKRQQRITALLALGFRFEEAVSRGFPALPELVR